MQKRAGQRNISEASNENEFQEMTGITKDWFQNNSFPNTQMIEPPDIETPSNPISKKQLFNDLNKLKFAMNGIGVEILRTVHKGKTTNPPPHKPPNHLC